MLTVVIEGSSLMNNHMFLWREKKTKYLNTIQEIFLDVVVS